MSTPAVLPGSIAAARCLDVVRGQELAQLGFDCLQFAELFDIGQLGRLDAAVRVLGEDQDIDHPDGAGVDQRSQFGRHLTGEVARSRRELDDDVVNRA